MIEFIAENGDCIRFTTKKWNCYNLFIIHKFIDYISQLLAKEKDNTKYYAQLKNLCETLQYYHSIIHNKADISLLLYNKIITLIQRHENILQYYELNGILFALTKTFYQYNDIFCIIEYFQKIQYNINHYRDEPKMYKTHVEFYEFLLDCKTNTMNIEIVVI